MRRQLLFSTLAAATAAVVLLGLPLAVAVQASLSRQALDQLQAEAERAALLVEEASLPPSVRLDLLDELASRSDARIWVLDLRQEPVVLVEFDSGAPPAVPPDFVADLAQAAAGRVGRSVGDGLLAAAVPLREGGRVLRAVRTDEALRRATRQSLLAIGGLVLTSLGAAAVIAGWQGRRLATPLERLADSARRLGEGDFSARAPRSGLEEPDAVAEALDTTATRLGAMLERSRSFGADASHQLRTPLTALQLDLEALEASGADPDLLAAAMAEADRLEATIQELLTLAEPPAGEEIVDLGALAAERLDAWQSLARAQGRDVVLDRRPVPPVRARSAALGQGLQVLLDNALAHGEGTITVSVQPISGGARLCVADQGPGIAPEREATLLSGAATEPPRGTGGRGLALARSLVEAEGGRLTLERARPGAMLCLLLPAATLPPGSVPPPPGSS